MRFKVACHNLSDDSFFEDEVEIRSAMFATDDEMAEAVRRLYDSCSAPIEVLLIKELAVVERRCF